MSNQNVYNSLLSLLSNLCLIKMLALWVFMLIAAATPLPERPSNCSERCGDVEVPYPFGILRNTSGAVENPECAIRRELLFFCNTNLLPHRLFFGDNMPIHHISVEEGIISVEVDSAFQCYKDKQLESHFAQSTKLVGPFRVSDKHNKLTAIGCDTVVLMQDYNQSFGSGCISMCRKNVTLWGSCSGHGCCQTSVPKHLRNLTIDLYSLNNHDQIENFNPCDFAFLADERTFNIADWQLPASPELRPGKYRYSDVVIEWVAGEDECKKAQSSPDYFCGNNTDCQYSDNAQGYRCACQPGFSGNPYRPFGCQDIDECSQPNKYPCAGSCKNNVGNYTCNCPMGMRGDGKTGCHGLRVTIILAVVAAAVLVLIILAVVLIMCIRRRKEMTFIRNGGALLSRQRMRLFSEAELARATNKYEKDHLLGEGGFGRVYKGVLADGTEIAVKRAKGTNKAEVNDEYAHEIEILSQVNHKNVVKMLGLCLETEVPLLVYEFIPNGTLSQHLHSRNSQALAGWETRLRIAKETADALNYLHSLADPPIIHGDVKADNILLDHAYTAKVSDFGASVLSSPEEPIIASQVKGTLGYLDPEYLMTGCLTDKSDVYSFGVVLVELLTGVKPTSRARGGEQKTIIHYFLSSVERHRIQELLCFEVESEGEMREIEALAEIAKNCLRSSGVDRPAMKEVVEEFGRMRKLAEKGKWSTDENAPETQHLLGEGESSAAATSRNRRQILRIESSRF